MSLQRQNDVKVSPRMRWSQVSKLVTPRTPEWRRRSRDCCFSTQRSGRPTRRCARRNTASGKPTAGPPWPRWWSTLACGLHQAGLAAGDHMVVMGANRPRLYATMLAAQSLGAVPIPLYQDAVAAECVFPINNAEVRFAFAEDQEQVDKLLEIRDQCPQLGRHLLRRPARPAQVQRARPRVAGRPAADGQGLRRAASLVLPDRGREGQARRRGRDVLHLGHHRQSQGRGAHPPQLAGPRPRRRPVRQAHASRRSAGLPAAGLDRPEHLQLRAVAGLRLCGQLPRVGRHRDDRPQGDRADLLLRAAAGVRSPADHRDDPHGGRRLAQAQDVQWLHGRGQARGPRADGRQAGRRRRPPDLCPGQCVRVWAVAQQPGLFAGARGLHRGRGDRPGPVHLLPVHRHQPQAALRLDRDRGVRLPAARRPGQGRHGGHPDQRGRDQGRRQRRDPGALAGPAQGVLQEPRRPRPKC